MVKKKDSSGKVKVGGLKVEKETVQDLGADEMKEVEGASFVFTCGNCVSVACPTNLGTCAGRTCGKKCRP